MNEYYEYFGPTYRLDVPQSNTEDLNTSEYLEKIKAQVFENLRQTGGGSAPSVQSQRAFGVSLVCALLEYADEPSPPRCR
jgi:histone deacetylase 1/2